ncbi:hypothetical protein Vi05172_g4009 [Venturia inaequalis]|nr:hypothetical protein Vi05172_g4009 [Venturia inaequalis]
MPRDEEDRERRRRSSRDPESDRERTRDTDRQQRRRRTHRATDSQGELLPKHGSYRDHSAGTPPRLRAGSSSASSKPLSLGSLAQLDAVNAKKGWSSRQGEYDEAYLQEVRDREARLEKERRKEERAIERERRRAARAEAEEEERRLEEIAQQRAERAARQRTTDDEREQRREEKRRQKREEKERQRQLELEAHNATLRNREREPEGERTQRSRPERERDRRRREYSTARESEHEYTSSEEAKERAYRAEKRRRSKYAELPMESPSARDSATRKKSRIISGPYLEDGRSEEVYEYRRDKLTDSDVSGPTATTTDSMWTRKRNKRIAIYVAVFIVLLLIIIPVAVVVSRKSGGQLKSAAAASSTTPTKSELNGLDHNSIPAADQGTYYDPWSWYDTTNFNVTYTKELVGGLPIMGLNSTWDDSVQANSKVPALKDAFAYGSMPIRGMNIGGWLSLEPWITPSLFNRYSQKEVIDEYTLTTKLGGTAASTLESHYSAFVNFQTFADIRAAGFDHVRIPFSYWAVTTYAGDPYVKQISWRYLLRGIEWARQNGLRINLDLHGLPGSQNGWNHSGRQGYIGWLNGTDGTLNGQRSIDIHDQLSQFFAQPRYKNIVTMYGLANEPRMTGLDTSLVMAWTTNAISKIRSNNITAIIIFGDGFMGLDNWQGKLQTETNLLLDVHQYVVFNTDLLQMTHSKKLTFACAGWQAQMTRSQNKATGFGPTMCGEWSQADTDCAANLNNVGMGNRWQGTLATGNSSTQVLQPFCPLKSSACDCTSANADPSKYSDAYKQWLLGFATAQMESFEYGWGWFYWTWATETSVQWSWKLGMKAGILPKTVWDRSFSCNSSVPDYAGMGLSEAY